MASIARHMPALLPFLIPLVGYSREKVESLGITRATTACEPVLLQEPGLLLDLWLAVQVTVSKGGGSPTTRGTFEVTTLQ
jgi:hypothetical protein